MNRLLNELYGLGVREVVCAPGGRNAKIWMAFLDDPRFQTNKVFDERTGAFFALGKSFERPTVMLTTSGSAVAQVYGAVLEAYYQKDSRLIVITADRPKEYRGTGSPQTINQSQFFGEHALFFKEIEDTDTENIDVENAVENLVELSYPAHINLCLQDPNPLRESGALGSFGSCVIVGELNLKERRLVQKALCEYTGVLVLESLSNLNEKDFPKACVLKFPEKTLSHFGLKSFSSFVRLGGVPVLKHWRHLQGNQIYYWDLHPFSGHPGAQPFELSDLNSLLNVNPLDQILKFELNLHKKFESLCLKFSKSEVSLLKKLSLSLPQESQVFLGNSLPVREWEHCKRPDFTHFGQRGVNGIDGTLALALGRLNPKKNNVLILGDLTFLYNVNDLQILKNLNSNISLKVIVIDNCGGQIFSKLNFKNHLSEFINAQAVCLDSCVKAWGLQNQVQILNVDLEQTQSFNLAWKAL